MVNDSISEQGQKASRSGQTVEDATSWTGVCLVMVANVHKHRLQPQQHNFGYDLAVHLEEQDWLTIYLGHRGHLF